MNIAVLSFRNNDIEAGVSELIHKYEKQSPTIVLPVTGQDQTFVQSVIRACVDHNTPIKALVAHAGGIEVLTQQCDEVQTSENPVKDLVRELGPGDVLGFVWDDSDPMHFILHAIEDLALDVWNIKNGSLEPIDFEVNEFSMRDERELHDLMHKSLGMFVDALAAFVSTTVMNALSEAIDEATDHMRPDDHFGDDTL